MRVVWPLPPDSKANRVDAKFLDPSYPAFRKKMGLSPDEHPGVDINLTGTSGDQDLRYPIVAILPMRIIHARNHRVWGNVVLGEVPAHICSKLGYPYLAVQYAHMRDVLVKEGDFLYPGDLVGTIGKGDPAFPFLAHLHMEIRTRPLPPDHWPRTRENILNSYIDPVEFLSKHESYVRRYYFPMGIALEDPSTDIVVLNMNDPAKVYLRLPAYNGRRR